LEQVFVFEDGDGDEREEGGERREKVLFYVFLFFLFFSLGA
jgi:hypothetical protein